jgi:hypothetical protein
MKNWIILALIILGVFLLFKTKEKMSNSMLKSDLEKKVDEIVIEEKKIGEILLIYESSQEESLDSRLNKFKDNLKNIFEEETMIDDLYFELRMHRDYTQQKNIIRKFLAYLTLNVKYSEIKEILSS